MKDKGLASAPRVRVNGKDKSNVLKLAEQKITYYWIVIFGWLYYVFVFVAKLRSFLYFLTMVLQEINASIEFSWVAVSQLLNMFLSIRLFAFVAVFFACCLGGAAMDRPWATSIKTKLTESARVAIITASALPRRGP